MIEQENTATVMVKEGGSREDEETKVAGAANVSAAATVDSSLQAAPTLRDAFQVPEKASDKGNTHWQAFQDKLKEEAKGIKWTAAMPDLGAKICELLDIKIHDVLMTAWKKAEALRQALADSKLDPERSIYLDLAEHSIDYETKPFIDVKIKGASVKKITLTVTLNLKLKGFTLKVQNGAISQIQTGSCEGKGTIKYDKLAIAEKKLSPIKFPLTINVPISSRLPKPPTKTLPPSRKQRMKRQRARHQQMTPPLLRSPTIRKPRTRWSELNCDPERELMSGFTDDAIVGSGLLDEAFPLEKPVSHELLASKTLELFDA